jgi:hypothetical protein
MRPNRHSLHSFGQVAGVLRSEEIKKGIARIAPNLTFSDDIEFEIAEKKKESLESLSKEQEFGGKVMASTTSSEMAELCIFLQRTFDVQEVAQPMKLLEA